MNITIEQELTVDKECLGVEAFLNVDGGLLDNHMVTLINSTTISNALSRMIYKDKYLTEEEAYAIISKLKTDVDKVHEVFESNFGIKEDGISANGLELTYEGVTYRVGDKTQWKKPSPSGHIHLRHIKSFGPKEDGAFTLVHYEEGGFDMLYDIVKVEEGETL